MVLESWLVAFSAWAYDFALAYGYPGVFIINLIGSATILFPVPAFAVTFALGAVLNPWILGIVAAFGSAIGEFTGYYLGYGSHGTLKKKYKKWIERMMDFAEKRSMFLTIIVIAATPIPTDIGGILAGIAKYDTRKFFLAMLIGKIINYSVIAWAGFFGIGWILQLFGIG
jgi:membrane protein YqaA with SNARE-associated domain